jgi:hypothetical protein
MVSNWCICVCVCVHKNMGRDNLVGTAIRYGLYVPGIQTQWGRVFPHPSRLALGSTQLPVQRVPDFFPVGKAAGAWR